MLIIWGFPAHLRGVCNTPLQARAAPFRGSLFAPCATRTAACGGALQAAKPSSGLVGWFMLGFGRDKSF
jgi:hypothetical protein